MTVYVDDLFDTTWANKGKWPYKRSCHMSADSTEELDAFALRLGMKVGWRQHTGRPTEHYDLVASKRALAIKLGAVAVNARDQARKRLEERNGTLKESDK